MSDHVKNVALLYLMNQDTNNLSFDELYALYRDTLHKVNDAEKHYQDTHSEDAFSFD